MKKNKKKKCVNSLDKIEIFKIKKENPSWGYRKVWSHLKEKTKEKIKPNAVYQIMKNNSMTLPKVVNLNPICDNNFSECFTICISFKLI